MTNHLRTPSGQGSFFHSLPVEISLDQCLKCNICTTACPVMGVTNKFPGPKYAGPQAARFRQPHQQSPDASVDYCSGCRVCNEACPAGVKIAEMNARARAELVAQGQVAPLTRLRNNLLAHTDLVGKIGQALAPLANLTFQLPPARKLADSFLGIAREAPFPLFARQKLTTWFKRRDHRNRASRQIVYFHGCATEYYEPRVGQAAIQILEKNGFEVIIPPQNCCGLPLLSNGEFPAARKLHKRNVDHLAPYARRGIPIVGTSTSCTLTLKEEAPELLDMYDEDTRLVAENTYDFSEFLLTLWENDELDTNFEPVPLTLAYHIPCQYRAHRIGKPGLQILNLIPELKVIESHVDCCGIAGTYGFKSEKYEISMQVGQPLFDFVVEVGGPVALCESETCRWQISHGSNVPTIHPVELIATAYGLPPEGALSEILTSFSKDKQR